jgi:hypothetical protein
MNSKFLRNLGNLKAVLLCDGLSFVSSNRMRGGEPGDQDRRWTPDGSEPLPMGGASCIRRQFSLRRIAPQWRLCSDGGSLRQEVRGPYVAMHVRINVNKMPNTLFHSLYTKMHGDGAQGAGDSVNCNMCNTDQIFNRKLMFQN